MAMYYTPIPNDFLSEMGELSDAEYGRLIRWCQNYSITGEEAELCGNERFFRIRCKTQIDKIKESYEDSTRKKSKAGKVGMDKRWHSDNTVITDNNTVITPDNTVITPITPDNTVITDDNSTITKITNNNNKNKNKTFKEKDISNEISKKKAADDVMSAWNDIADMSGTIPRIESIKPDSKRAIMLSARIKDNGLDNVLLAIDNIRRSRFLQGKESSWRITFDWFVKPSNFAKVLEGNYTDAPAPAAHGGSFADIAAQMMEEARYDP